MKQTKMVSTKINIQKHHQPHLLEVLADPQWDRGAPVSVSGNCPVACISQPISKSLFSHKLWDPAINRSETQTT